MINRLDSFLCQNWRELSQIAKNHCNGGYPDSEGCCWYHGNWLLLRCLGLVSNPVWHLNFYLREIKNHYKNHATVIGAADISMPYICHLASVDSILIADICNTPLSLCDKFSKIENLNWRTANVNLLQNCLSDYPSSLIVNDAFLTRFKKNEKLTILKKIYENLSNGGVYITTVRKGVYCENGYKSPVEFRNKFIKRAIEIAQKKGILCKKKVKIISHEYINKMISFPIESKQELSLLANSVGFKILNLFHVTVPGESETSEYFEVVMKKV